MKKCNSFLKIGALVVLFCVALPLATVHAAQALPPGTKDRINYFFDEILLQVPEVLKKIPPEIRRVVLYNFKSVSSDIDNDLVKLMRAKFEASLTQTAYQKVVFIPELKPLKVVLKDNDFSIKTSLSSTEELRDIGRRMRLDGIVNCELSVTPKSLNMFIQVIDVETSGIVLAEIVTAGTGYVTQSMDDRKNISMGAFYSFGVQNFSVTGGTIALNSVNYYSNELFFIEHADLASKVKFGIGGGILYLGSGFSEQDPSNFIGSTTGSGLAGAYIKAGIFFKMIPNPGNKKRNFLDLYTGVVRIFTFNVPDITVIEVGLSSDISSTFGLSFTLDYIPPVDITLKNKTRVTLGTLGYHFQFIKIKF